MKLVGAVILCYLIGSIPFSYIFTRLFTKQDIRKKGSGNVGATNVLRTSGPAVAVLALLGDLFKGVAAGFIALHFGTWPYIVFCSLAVVLGHCYPVALKFKGGKGVATAAGVVLVFTPLVLGILALIFVATIVISKYVSLGSITAALFLPVMIIATGRPWPYLIAGSLICLVVVYRHRENILRLRRGTESKINQRV
ncbi:MAG: glycerol-3-phosphate 1-O-acyltransferase PlsY [Syntrophomonadaceae bacterium]